jgi:hypothetical protein
MSIVVLGCKADYKSRNKSTKRNIDQEFRGENFEIPSIENWKRGVRLKGIGGWGMFFYVCSIYDENPKRIQLIYQNRLEPIDYNGHSYSYKERILPNSEYDSLMQLIKESGIEEMPKRLERYDVIDGPNYSVKIKSDTTVKIVSWQDMGDLTPPELEIPEEEKLVKQKAITVFKSILDHANYPRPRWKLSRRFKTKGIVTYSITLNDYNLLVDYSVEFEGKEFKERDYYTREIDLPIGDTMNLDKKLKVRGVLGNGDTVLLKKFPL